MDDRDTAINEPALWRGDFLFALGLFVSGVIAFAFALPDSGILSGPYGWGTALFFLLFGLFTITMGYARPGFGHVSFDRVAQVSSILVLGPVDAAWINGLASAIYPLHRIWKGVPVYEVAMASIHNAGMMILIILSCGSLYAYLGGPIPLIGLDLRVGGLLLLLTLSMQGLNDAIMAIMMHLRRTGAATMVNAFSFGVELASVPLAILVAIVFASAELPVLILLLFSMSLGMLVLKQFAEMRNKLEALVEARTEELRIKSEELERQATHDKLTGLFNRRFVDDFSAAGSGKLQAPRSSAHNCIWQILIISNGSTTVIHMPLATRCFAALVTYWSIAAARRMSLRVMVAKNFYSVSRTPALNLPNRFVRKSEVPSRRRTGPISARESGLRLVSALPKSA